MEIETSPLAGETTRTVRFRSFVDDDDDGPSYSTKTCVRRCIKEQCRSWTLQGCFDACLNRIPLIRCLTRYNIRQDLFGDLVAGVTVAIMHIPQGMAYGALASLPPVHGLYVSFFPALIYMIFGTCPHLSIGTFALVSLMTSQAIDRVLSQPINGTESLLNSTAIVDERVNVATTLALLVGLVQVLFFLLRLGFLTVYLTEPFVSGFTSGAALHALTSQVPLVLGVKAKRRIRGPFKLPKVYLHLIRSLSSDINGMSTGVALVSIIALYVAKELNDRYKSTIRVILPSELLLLIIGTLVSHFARLPSAYNVSVVGHIKHGLPSPSVPSLDKVDQLIVPTISLVIVSLAVSISLAKIFGQRHSYKVSSNQELLAYGMANTVASFFQCYPSAGSLSRSVVQEGSGGKTVLTGAFSSLLVGSVLLALTGLFQSLPMACLAAIIIVNLKGLFLQWNDFLFYFRVNILEWIVWSVTFFGVTLVDVDLGIYAGIVTSFILNTVRTQKPHFVVLALPSEDSRQIRILRFDESLYAGNVHFFKRKFYELVSSQAAEESYRYIILELSPCNYIDTAGVKVLVQIFNDLKKRGMTLYLSECRSEVRHALKLMKFNETTAANSMYVSTQDAVFSAIQGLKNGAIPTDQQPLPLESICNNDIPVSNTVQV